MASSTPPKPGNPHVTQGRIWALAWPIMLSNITVPLLGLADSAILGHLDDPLPLGGVAIASQLFVLLFWSFGFLRMGTTALTANADNSRALITLQQALFLALMLTPILMLLAILLWPLALPLMTDNPALQQSAADYLSIRVFSTPATLAQYALLGWFIGLGQTRIPLILLTVTNVFNAAANYVLVFHFDMRADGVALGTLCAEYLTLALSLYFVYRLSQQSQQTRPWQQPAWFKRPAWQTLKPMVQVNQHLFVRTLVLLSTFAFFTAAGAAQSPLILAANAMLISLLLLISNALDGFANAAEVLAGRASHQRDGDSLRRAIKLTGINSALTALLLCLLFIAFGEPLLNLLTDQPALIAELHNYKYYLYFLPVIGFASYWLDGIFVGTANSRAMKNAMICAALMVFYPLCWLLWSQGNHGLWLAFYAFTLARALFLLKPTIQLWQASKSY